MPRALRDRKKVEFMALEQGGMSMDAFEAMFPTFSRYATQISDYGRGHDPFVYLGIKF